MEFIAEHPLCLLQALTALVSFAAGFTTYHFGVRRASSRDHSGSGGQHGLLSRPPARSAAQPRRSRRVPPQPQGLVVDAARTPSAARTPFAAGPLSDYALVA